jgi:outer membrane murein-binding lipoprotein Lpp
MDLRAEGIVLAIAVAVGAIAGSHYTHKYDKAQEDRAELARQQAQARERERTDVVTAQADTHAAKVADENARVNQSIVSEVPNRVPKTVSCPAFVDAVRVLNNAAASGVPVSAPARPADVPAAPVADDPGPDPAEVERVNVENLGQCRADAARFRELQNWIDGVSAHESR